MPESKVSDSKANTRVVYNSNVDRGSQNWLNEWLKFNRTSYAEVAARKAKGKLKILENKSLVSKNNCKPNQCVPKQTFKTGYVNGDICTVIRSTKNKVCTDNATVVKNRFDVLQNVNDKDVDSSKIVHVNRERKHVSQNKKPGFHAKSVTTGAGTDVPPCKYVNNNVTPSKPVV